MLRGNHPSCALLTGSYDLLFRYLPATLSANDGNIIKTVTIKNLFNSLLKSELSASFSDDVSTSKIPIIPNATEATIKIRVAIFCIHLV